MLFCHRIITSRLKWALFILCLPNAVLASGKSPFSQLPIPGSCQADYQKGMELVEVKMKQGFPFSDLDRKVSLIDKFLSKYDPDNACQFYASLGIHDSVTFIKKQILTELALELKFHSNDEHKKSINSVLRLYRERMTAIGEDLEELESFVENNELVTATVHRLYSTLNEQADRQQAAIPFGRFVFLGSDAILQSLYDYEVDVDGEFLIDAKNQVKTIPGSYQRLARSHFERTKNIVEEYLQWNPSVFFGKDSFWKGAFWRYFSKNPEPSLRETKESGYFKLMDMQVRSAEKLKLDTSAYRAMYKLMLDKQKATLERDIKAYDKVDRYKWAALFVPVGMYVGASAMAATGWMAAVPSGSSFTYLGGSLAYAANTSALVSLSTMGAFSAIGAHQVHKVYRSEKEQGRSLRWTSAFDIMAMATIESFPLAAIAPVVVGGSMLAGQTAFLSGRSLLLRSISLSQNVYKAGFSGTMRQVGSYALKLPGKIVHLPKFIFNKWLTAWYKNPKLLLTHYGVDVAFTVFFDCGYRQIKMAGESKCYYKNESGNHINKHFLYSLGGSVIIGPLSKPIALIKGFGLRWATYRVFDTFSAALIQLVVSGKVDRERLMFDGMYGATIGTGIGEINRSVKLSQFVTSKSIGSQAALLILFKALVMQPVSTPLYLGLQDRYLKGELKPGSEVKKLVNDWAMIDLSDFSDDDIEGVLESLENDPEFLQLLEENSVQ